MKFADLEAMSDEQLKAALEDITETLNERRKKKVEQALKKFFIAAQELDAACDGYARFTVEDPECYQITFNPAHLRRDDFKF